MYFNGYFNLDDWDSTALFLIFDDVPWERIHNKKAFFGAQEQFVLTDKYRKKITVKWGKPCIYLCNPEDFPPELNTEWYQENVVICNIQNKLY